MPSTRLETDRLILRAPEQEMAEPIVWYFLRNRGFLQPFEPPYELDFFTVARQSESIQKSMDAWREDRRYWFWLYKKQRTERVIGGVGLSNIVRGAFQSCFLGYRLDEGEINKGLMTEAVRRIVEFGFDELKNLYSQLGTLS